MDATAADPATDAPPSADGILPEHAHPIRLPVFEGPLDLLLYLIRKNEIDIHDIPVGVVTKQYLEVLRSYERMNLDVAGEFFVMAATLMVIKSRMLLPPEKLPATPEGEETAPDDDENLDPRWQLVRQLIQYKRIKETAGHLHALIEARQGFALRVIPPPQEKESDRPVAASDRIELWTTFNNLLRRLGDRVLPGEIRGETVTITTRMEDILARLRSEKKFAFSSLLPERPTSPLLVATFLACLELARLGKILLGQSANFDDILCEERPADDPLVLDFDTPAETDDAPRADDTPESPADDESPDVVEDEELEDDEWDDDDLDEELDSEDEESAPADEDPPHTP